MKKDKLEASRIKNVFVLCAGRCGSMTFTRACEHMSNYSVSHESRVSKYGDDRVDYPLYHIEVDNRLSWFLGRLDNKYRDDAVYVHLTRDPQKIAESYNRRWVYPGTIVRAFSNGILMSKELSINPCVDYVRTVSENITHFLRNKTQVFHINIDSPESSFSEFWKYIKAEGDLDLALEEFKTLHNPNLLDSKSEDTNSEKASNDTVASLERVIQLSYQERVKVFSLLSEKDKLVTTKDVEISRLNQELTEYVSEKSELAKVKDVEISRLNQQLSELKHVTQRSEQLESRIGEYESASVEIKKENKHLFKLATDLEKYNSTTFHDYNKLASQHNHSLARVHALETSTSYRLGHALIKNIKSPLNWLKLPFALIKALGSKPHSSLVLVEPKRTEFLQRVSAKSRRVPVEPPNKVFYKSSIIAETSFEEAEKFIDLYGTTQDKSSFNIVRANNALHEKLSETRWLNYINAYLSKYEISPLKLQNTGKNLFERLTSDTAYKIKDEILVSVIMPAFNCEKTLRHSAESILNQTWSNIQLIIVDDCSSDRTWEVIQDLEKQDSRVVGLKNPVNVGPYVSKNRALKYVEGTYFTGQDADDWSHPQRIERQLASLRVRKSMKAIVSHMIRITPEGEAKQLKILGRISFDGVAVLSPISCLFETKFFIENLGCWDAVRFSGDSELLGRMEIILGDDLLKHNFVTMVCQDIEGSLTNNPTTGVRVGGKGLSPVRKAYQAAYREWHKELADSGDKNCKLDMIGERRPFLVPDEMSVPKSNLHKVYES